MSKTCVLNKNGIPQKSLNFLQSLHDEACSLGKVRIKKAVEFAIRALNNEPVDDEDSGLMLMSSMIIQVLQKNTGQLTKLSGVFEMLEKIDERSL